MSTISFDFDYTLFDYHERVFIDETVSLMKDYINQGHRIIITTSREPRWADEAKRLISERLGFDLEVFSAPGNINDWRDCDPVKSDILIREGAIKHYDDIPDDEGLMRARLNGIEILLPPAIRATITRMY